MRLVAIQNGTLAIIIAVVLADLFLIYFITGYARRNRAVKQAAAGETPAPKGGAVSRRDFQRRALLSATMLFGAEFGLGTIAFLWPNLKGGFGSKINAGPLTDIKAQIAANDYVYVGSGRFYVVPWEGTAGHRVGRLSGRGRHRRGRHAPVSALRAPRVPRAVLRLVPMVRVPVSRLEVQPCRANTSWARRRAGSIASRWRSSTAT